MNLQGEMIREDLFFIPFTVHFIDGCETLELIPTPIPQYQQYIVQSGIVKQLGTT